MSRVKGNRKWVLTTLAFHLSLPLLLNLLNIQSTNAYDDFHTLGRFEVTDAMRNSLGRIYAHLEAQMTLHPTDWVNVLFTHFRDQFNAAFEHNEGQDSLLLLLLNDFKLIPEIYGNKR